MKKFTLVSLLALAMSTGAYAQQASPVLKLDGVKKVNTAGGQKLASPNSTAAIEQFFIDYTWLDNEFSLGWYFNSQYTSSDTTGSGIANLLNFYGLSVIPVDNVIPTTLNLADQVNTYQEYPYYYNSITIDTVVVQAVQENNSGATDTFRLKLVNLVGSANAPTGTVKQTYEFTSDTSQSFSPSGSGNVFGDRYITFLTFPVSYTSTNGEKFGFQFEYIAPKQDSLIVLASVINDGTDEDPQFQTFSSYPNTFFRLVYSNILRNIDAELVGGGAFPIQNWNLYALATYDVTSISENEYIKGVKIGQSFPNPASGTTKFFYELQKPTNVSFQVTDMNGRLVKEYNEGSKVAGKHSHVIDLASFNNGVYFYTIKTDATTITKRFVVAN